MKIFLILCLSVLASNPVYSAVSQKTKAVMVIHGGIGENKKDLTPELDKLYRAGLTEALQAGYAALSQGKSSLDAVEAAIRSMEDNPVFNAGKGAVFTHEGKNELDASIMNGANKMAGAVSSVTTIKNPISAARAVMEKTRHVLLTSIGAERFAKEAGLEIVDPKYFWTESSWKELQQALEAEKLKKQGAALPSKHHFGTVGAVALDSQGNLAAGTSTGGLTNKAAGRVGDSPIIGAGTYAENESCGVSATGHGEFFIRYAVAHDIVSLMKYKGYSVQKATDEVINKKLKSVSGEGGVIALDKAGNFSFSYNTEGMNRGYVTKDGKITVHLHEN